MGLLSLPRVIVSGLDSRTPVLETLLLLDQALKIENKSYSVSFYGTDFLAAYFFKNLINRFIPNLDPRLLDFNDMLNEIQNLESGADLQIITSKNGLYDSPSIDSYDGSIAELAVTTNTPVYLIVEDIGYGGGLIPLIKGFKSYAKGLEIAGVIILRDPLSGLSFEKTREKYRNLIDKYIKIDFISIVNHPKIYQLNLPSGNHHSLKVPYIKREVMSEYFEKNLNQISAYHFFEVAKRARQIKFQNNIQYKASDKLDVLYFDDPAFRLVYHNNYNYLKNSGINLVPFSPLSDYELPDNINGIYIGSFIIEDYLETILENHQIAKDLRKLIEKGVPLYLEGNSIALLGEKLSYVTDSQELEFNCFNVLPLSTKLWRQKSGKKLYQKKEVSLPVYSGAKDLTIAELNNLNLDITHFKEDNDLYLSDYGDYLSNSQNIFMSKGHINFSASPEIGELFIRAVEQSALK